MRTTFVRSWMMGGVLLALGAGLYAQEGAVLRSPFDDPVPRATAKTSEAPEPGPAASGPSAFDRLLAAIAVDPRYAVNRDIQPTPDVGPWMICVHSYVTKDAPHWAREMATELRTTHRLPAYVFTYGLDERRKEFERVKVLVDRQREFLKDKDLPIVFAPRGRDKDDIRPAKFSDDLPIEYISNLMKVKHIPVQCAVLVGGYADENAAKRALDTIRKMKPPDAAKVKLDTQFYTEGDEKNPKTLRGEHVYVNPFSRAFMCRNPSMRVDRPGDKGDGFNVETLRRLNADEPLTVLNIKKPLTLAIKEFRTYTIIQDRERERSVLDNFGFKTRGNSEGFDSAAHDAHNLAELLRKRQIDAYVLHTKFSSVVTVGAFDALEDPNLVATQKYLERQLASIDQQLPPASRIMFFAKAMPMQVPR